MSTSGTANDLLIVKSVLKNLGPVNWFRHCSPKPVVAKPKFEARRQGFAAVSYVEVEYRISERHACRLAGLGPSTYRYRLRKAERDAAL